MTVGGLQPNVQQQRTDGGQIDQAFGQVYAPVDNLLQLANTAFGGSVAQPTLAPSILTPFVNVPFQDGSRISAANGFLTYTNPQGTSIRLGAGGGAGATGSVTPSQITPGTNGQVLTTVGSAVQWSAPTTGTTYSVFGGSGASHSTGLVPDPGATAGTARYLREDSSWATPPTGSTYSIFGASGTGHSSGLVPDPGASAGTARYLREDASWGTPPGTTYSVFSGSGTGHSVGLVPDPGATAGTARYLREDSTWVSPPTGSGTVTSVGFSVGTNNLLTLTGTSPITTSGSFGLSWNTVAPTKFFAGDVYGGSTIVPAFRSIAVADLPGLPAAQITSGTFLASQLPVFVASGTSHAQGAVPDPGATAGTARYLREDATWATPAGGTTYSVFGASGASHSSGLVPDPGSTAGTARFLREDSTWSTPAGGGTVTSVGLTTATNPLFSIINSPITTSGNMQFSWIASAPFLVYATGTTAGTNQAPTLRSLTAADLPALAASGTGHAAGIAPDPGSTAGTVRYLREDASWATPPDHTYVVFGASGTSHASGLVPDPGSTAGTARYLREDSTWATPSGGSSGLQVNIEGVLAYSTTLTWSGSGGAAQAYTWTVPSTLNGNTLNWAIITKVACSLLSGSPGTSATFGVKIAGTSVVGTRQLPPYAGGVNVSIVDLNINTLSATSVNAVATNTVVVTPSGTFSGSSTWRVDIIGYYL